MASKKKAKTQNSSENPFVIPLEKKKKILGILLVVFSFLILLSILSFNKNDLSSLNYSFTDLFKVFSSDPEFIKRAENTANLLGIFGAYISGFFVNLTIGYFSAAFPIVLFLIGYAVIFNKEIKQIFHLINFVIAFGLLFASFFGMLQSQFGILNETVSLYGKVGLFIGSAIGRLLGGLGAVIFFITILFILLFLIFDFKIEDIIEYIKNLWNSGENKEEKPVKIKSEEKTPVVSENLNKVKELREQDKKVTNEDIENLFNGLEDDFDDEPLPEKKPTTIKIRRTDETELDNPVPVEVVSPTPVNRFSVLNKGFEDEELSKLDDFDFSDRNEKDDIDYSIDDISKETPEQWEEQLKYTEPSLDLLRPATETDEVMVDDEELRKNAELLKQKLELFDIKIDKIEVTPGPVVTLYELVPAPGVKISKIVSLENDIALALAAKGIRIIAPIPGKGAIGVEIPNNNAQLVSARTVLGKLKDYKFELPLALGKDIAGEIYVTDLTKMPHLLIAGSTGSGKSVGINMLISSLLYSMHPSDLKLVIVDPKKIELSFYGKLNKHFLAVSPDIEEEIITNPQNAVAVLKSVEIEMERRYDKLAKAQVRNIVDYNKKVLDPKKKPADSPSMKHYKMPYLVVIIDELADLMMTSGKEVEAPIARLAQLARAVGIHLVVATQRPSVNVITGVIKANFPARVAYQTATRIDSRTILDMKGAEQLLGRGDMLFLPGGFPKPVRIQNAFITTDEVEKVTNYIYTQQGFSKRYLLPSIIEKKSSSGDGSLGDMDPMFEDAARVIVRHQQGSVSLLQRKLKLGYSRAARIVDQLEDAGVVGPAEGSKAREVRIETEEELEVILKSLL